MGIIRWEWEGNGNNSHSRTPLLCGSTQVCRCVLSPSLSDAGAGSNDGWYPGERLLPLRAHSGVTHAVKTEYEETLKIDRDHEHRL